MATAPNCAMTSDQVKEAFLAAPPLIAESIIDLTVKHPNWMRDIFEVEEWPRGNGTIMEQLVFRGRMPQIERGFEQWKKLNNNSGCQPCTGPDPSYNWTNFGGNGFERKITELMSREFRSPAYNIKEIQTTAHFDEVFAKIVENLYRQVDFFKEMNIGLNTLTMLAKKYVVDSGGAKPNTSNPYLYPALGTATISSLNITMLEYFYEYLRKNPSAVPYDVINGSPIFALECSHQLLAHLYRDDPDLRQDVRFSGMANENLMKYNFMTTIRGMFIPAPMLYPRRFKADVSGNLIEVLPFVNDVPLEVGEYTDFNPLYEQAPYEEVILHGKFPFKIFYMPTETTLGDNSSFGPEFAWFNSWLWINPLTVEDPFRRVGYFATSATIGVSQQFSDAIYSIVVQRPPVSLMVTFFPSPICPPVDPSCSNEIPATGCPCPLILGYNQNPITLTNYFFNLATPTTAVADDSIQLGLDNGAYLTGTVANVSSDSLSVEVTFGAGTDLGTCDHFTTLFCDDTLGCSSDVLTATDCRSDVTDAVTLFLKSPIKATDVNDVITATMGDGTTQNLKVVSVDFAQNAWTVQYAAGYTPTDGNNAPLSADMLCDRHGILSVCVPPSTDSTCPACGGPTYTQCS